MASPSRGIKTLFNSLSSKCKKQRPPSFDLKNYTDFRIINIIIIIRLGTRFAISFQRFYNFKIKQICCISVFAVDLRRDFSVSTIFGVVIYYTTRYIFANDKQGCIVYVLLRLLWEILSPCITGVITGVLRRMSV